MRNLQTIDFKDDLREAVIDQLRFYGVHFNEKQNLLKLLIKLYTFLEKYIRPTSRLVFISEELAQRLPSLPTSVQEALKKMQEWIHAGVDINCFQGRGLYGKGNRDYLNMLYGVVHLHLSAKQSDFSPAIKGDKFAKPAKYLLYAYFTGNAAYFIDVVSHPESNSRNISEWIGKRILEIVAKNWPKLIENRIINAKLCDKAGNTMSIDDNALSQLTLNHINTGIVIGNNLYLPNSGITSSGDSALAVLKADKAFNDAVLAQINYQKSANIINKNLLSMLESHGRVVPDELEIHYDYIPVLERFVVMERNSMAAWDFKKGNICIFSENTSENDN